MAPAFNEPPASVTMTSPPNGTTVTGKVSVAANATSTVGIPGVQFKLDGANLGSLVTGAGPSYTTLGDTTLAGNGRHSVSAVETDVNGLTATSSGISVTVSNTPPPPVLSNVRASSITSSGATISWTTDQPSNSQVAYGTSSSYGFLRALNPALVTSHSVILTGLSPSTTYHSKAQSTAAGALGGLPASTLTPHPPVTPLPGYE